MINYNKINNHCKKIDIYDKDIIRYIYNGQKKLSHNGYVETKIYRICDLSSKKFVEKIINDIKENRIEKFIKKTYNIENYDYEKLILKHFGNCNNLILYIFNILSQNKNVKVKDLLYLCSIHFNIVETTVRRHIDNFIKSSKQNDFSIERFILYIKWQILKGH